ncbi:MAG: hypothetical protein ACI8XD_000824, partial [Thermoproteota archaeon]
MCHLEHESGLNVTTFEHLDQINYDARWLTCRVWLEDQHLQVDQHQPEDQHLQVDQHQPEDQHLQVDQHQPEDQHLQVD